LADCLASFYDDPGPLPQPVAAQPGSHPDAVLLELDDPPVDVRGHSLTELLRPASPAMSDAARRRITSPATPHQDQEHRRNGRGREIPQAIAAGPLTALTRCVLLRLP